MFVLRAALFFPFTSAILHHLFVGNLQLPASIHTLEFDDEALTLFRTTTFASDSSHAWIAFDHQKANIYGVSLSAKRIASYSIDSNLRVHLESSVNSTGDCSNQTSAFVLPSSSPPYTVYTGSWPGPHGCGMGISILPNGTLFNVTQTWKYNSTSGIHGLAAAGQKLYTADLSGDAIWTHKIHEDGSIELVARYSMPAAGMHPRHLAAHPGGRYIYAVMEAGNEVIAYSVDDEGVIQGDAGTYSLIPDRISPLACLDQKTIIHENTGNHTKQYWSAEVMLSHSNRLLWVTARAMTNSNITGYISCFNLDDRGFITHQIFMLPTTTTNGIANAVSPASWSDEFMAITDFPRGYVQIWQLVRGGNETDVNVRNRGGVLTGANMVAQVDVRDGGCCANAIWYD